MRPLIYLCAFLFSISIAQAKTTDPKIDKTGTVFGTVLDATLNQPLPYVNIIIKDAKNANITGGISLDDGTFTINQVPEGDIIVSIQYIGYKTVNKTITIGKNNYNVNLGTILLEEAAEGLDAVTVVAEVSTIQQKVDRKVITVGKDLTTAGTSASDIMNNIPSVSIDQQSGNISLRGNENVRVMVDGKLSNVPIAQLLKQIPSTSIKEIELITNPSAKYNPEGMSGIINIKLHKNTKIGFNGNLNVGLTHEVFAKFNSSVDMNYRNGKFNFYGNYGNNVGKYDNFGSILRLDDNSLQNFKFLNSGTSHLYKVGVDFYVNDKNTLSFFTNQNIYNGNNSGSAIISYESLKQSQLFNNISGNNSGQYNLAYKHEFTDENETLDIEIDYNDFENDELANFNFFNFDFPTNYVDNVDTQRQQTTVNIDYVKPVNDKTKIEAGLEARLFNTNIDYMSTGQTFSSEGDIIPTPSTGFDYNRDIYSAYFTYGKTLEKWNYQVGIRAEQVNVNADALKTFSDASTEFIPFENDYFQIYPSAFLTYNPSEKNSYQLSFSRRVDRPGLQQVNPIREWSTPRLSSFGNTELQPQFTNSLETNYTRQLEKGSITAGIFYRIIEDNINRYVFIDRTNITSGNSNLSYDNFDNTTAYGFELSTNYRPTKWWSLNGSFDLYSQRQQGIIEILNTDDIQNATVNDILKQNNEVETIIWNVRAFNNFKVSKKLSFSLFAMYRGEEESLQFTREPMYMVNTGMRYNFLEDNRATLSFNYNDIFNTMKFEFEGSTPFPNIGGFNWESNTWNIALSYRFGGNNYSALKRKQRENDTKSGGGGFM
ncbi:TonB-dependent receptor [Algibacter amylolyticus]|uniref:TonB-dependent receptor n=1 Tax=Algibacter amylolyticus TaxID=1608400 RepID=A0A5M7B4K6_9FLAO|nr:TonB-dependent receptor [Algibacter amylolyticus]KAA5824476.1 TonB-dependent receptor [Algibacter amylolyticus]MBB5269464.1 outer membrane receptor protein involved in Fe transport [Algibacter amylolyticus]TSJ75249.1 TonB-dependent receptor [Algibacter amylolyticus]